jgi:hypothetical protein
MNLPLFFQVVSRFRVLVVLGFCLAVALAVVSYAHVSFAGGKPQFTYRSEERWQSTATLLVTQPGGPWFRSILNEVVPLGPGGKGGYTPKFDGGGRLAGLASLYARLAKADEVRWIMLRHGPIPGEYDASGVTSETGSGLPLLAIMGFGSSPHRADAVASRATSAFLTYLNRLQRQSQIPPDARVTVNVLEHPAEAQLIQGRRKTKPIFLFVIVITATLMLAFTLENLRPRGRGGQQGGDEARILETPVGPNAAPLPEATQKSA